MLSFLIHLDHSSYGKISTMGIMQFKLDLIYYKQHSILKCFKYVSTGSRSTMISTRDIDLFQFTCGTPGYWVLGLVLQTVPELIMWFIWKYHLALISVFITPQPLRLRGIVVPRAGGRVGGRAAGQTSPVNTLTSIIFHGSFSNLARTFIVLRSRTSSIMEVLPH